MRWVAYLHPAAMLVVLALGIVVFREGLSLRRARMLRAPRDSQRHRRLARGFAALILLGYAAGLASMGWLREEALFQSVHFSLVTAALLGLGVAVILGFSLERRPSGPRRTAHALVGAVGLLLALLGAAAGMAILA